MILRFGALGPNPGSTPVVGFQLKLLPEELMDLGTNFVVIIRPGDIMIVPNVN